MNGYKTEFLTDKYVEHYGKPKIGNHILGYRITGVYRNTLRAGYEVVLEKENEEQMSYNTNGDVVETSTGEVFVFFGGYYYNLSTDKECRGRKIIKSELGPIQLIANLAGTGELLKEAHRDIKEAHEDTFIDQSIPF